MFEQQLTLIGIAAAVSVALEVWRRALRGRSPRWIHVVAILLAIEIVVGVAYAEYQLLRALPDDESGNKATALANHLSVAMNSNAIAVVGVVLDVLVLAIGSVLARRAPRRDAPVAKIRAAR